MLRCGWSPRRAKRPFDFEVFKIRKITVLGAMDSDLFDGNASIIASSVRKIRKTRDENEKRMNSANGIRNLARSFWANLINRIGNFNQNRVTRLSRLIEVKGDFSRLSDENIFVDKKKNLCSYFKRASNRGKFWKVEAVLKLDLFWCLI